MELNDEAQRAVSELGAAINSAIENSPRVAAAIQNLRDIGFDLQLSLKLEIGLRESGDDETDLMETNDFSPEKNINLELTDEDLRTLQRMKIRLDPEE